MNKNLAIDCAWIDGKPYLYFGYKRFPKGDKRIGDVSVELSDDGYLTIGTDRTKTTLVYVFKDLKQAGSIPRKTAATDFENPKFMIESTKKGMYTINEVK